MAGEEIQLLPNDITQMSITYFPQLGYLVVIPKDLINETNLSDSSGLEVKVIVQ